MYYPFNIANGLLSAVVVYGDYFSRRKMKRTDFCCRMDLHLVMCMTCCLLYCRSTSQTMGCRTDTVLMESTKNTKKTPKRGTMEPSSTRALTPTKDLVSLTIQKQMTSRKKSQKFLNFCLV